MKVLITENRVKTSRIVNGQEATVVSYHRNTLLVQFPDQQRAFVYPVTHHVQGQGEVTTYPLTPAYATTISKCQGQNIRHLLVWLDSTLVPPGLAYVALSRVGRKQDISILQPLKEFSSHTRQRIYLEHFLEENLCARQAKEYFSRFSCSSFPNSRK